jgi:hypothetical protein
MELFVHRLKNAENACTGTLDIDGIRECITLEDVIRNLGPNGEGKIPGKTGIPEGRYKVVIDFSEKFQKWMLHVLDVKFFTGIRIHSGNDDENTEGCLLVGQIKDNDDHIHGGSIELPILQGKIKNALDSNEEVWITYKNEFSESLK